MSCVILFIADRVAPAFRFCLDNSTLAQAIPIRYSFFYLSHIIVTPTHSTLQTSHLGLTNIQKAAIIDWLSGYGEAWYRAWFGSKRPRVQIPALRSQKGSVSTQRLRNFFLPRTRGLRRRPISHSSDNYSPICKTPSDHTARSEGVFSFLKRSGSGVGLHIDVLEPLIHQLGIDLGG